MSHDSTLRVLVVEDHPMFRDGLTALLDSIGGLHVDAAVSSAEDAFALLDATPDMPPDVVLMDLQLPGISGIEATRELVANHPGVAVLVLTMFDDDDSVFAALRAGARGYLLKEAEQEDIERAVRAVARGEVIFGASVAQRVLAFFANGGRPTARAFPELTDRELEILDLVAAGLNNAEITRRLVVSPKTVRNHLTNVFAKLHVADRAQAIVRAREAGLGSRPTPER